MSASATSKIAEEQTKYEKHLKDKGIKMTAGRRRVFDTVMHAHGHFAPEEIVKICRNNDTEVSRATIYRSIRELLESGVIRKTAFGEKHDLYEHMYDEKPHHHARCIRCSGVVEFPDMGEDKMYRDILGKKGFQILGHEMHFYGLCENCRDE